MAGVSPHRPLGRAGPAVVARRERARLMLAIYNVRATGAVSLEYLQRRTGFSRRRLWRAFEDLEDVGYVEVLDGDPRGPVLRWMDGRRSANAQVLASTFRELTEAGRHGPELADLVAEQYTARGRRGSAATRSRAVGGRRRLSSRITGMPTEATTMIIREWRNRGGEEDLREGDLARLNSVAYGKGAIWVVLLGGVLTFVTVV